MTRFEKFIGNAHIKRFLSHAFSSHQVGHSWLFSGPAGVGKMEFALAFAALLLGINEEEKTHPDLHLYRPEGKIGMHSLDTMRQFQHEVHLAPYEGARKVFILDDAERMLPSSANALLKTFEEPPLDSVILLISSHAEQLLPTILSRCRQLRFHPVAQKEISIWLERCHGIDASVAEKAARLGKGSVAAALRFAKSSSPSTQELLHPWLKKGRFTSYGALKEAAVAIGGELERYREELEKTAREDLSSNKRELTSFQKEAIEKEIEGMVTLRFRQEVFRQFEVFLGWHRDLIAIQRKVAPLYFIEQEEGWALEQGAQRGESKPLEEIQKAIMEARLAMERFIPLAHCFETLFLKTFLVSS